MQNRIKQIIRSLFVASVAGILIGAIYLTFALETLPDCTKPVAQCLADEDYFIDPFIAVVILIGVAAATGRNR